jgi:hypothetical protein
MKTELSLWQILIMDVFYILAESKTEVEVLNYILYTIVLKIYVYEYLSD